MVVYLHNRLLVRAAEAVYEVGTRYRVEFDHCYSGSVLTTVVLLLHEEI